MTDLAKTIAPKSDQLNADDLIAGPRTITITAVRGCDEPDQPIAVHFEGDNKKPYKPCKSMRRVMVHCWGPDGATYAGRRLTLYCDPNVQFGGIKVGGIRISHASHIERELVVALTVTRAKRSPYTVKPLRAEVRQASREQPDRRPPPPRDDETRAFGAQTEDPAPDDTFPGDRAAGGFGGDREPETDEHPAVAWARGVRDDLEAEAFTSVRALDGFCQRPDSGEHFAAYEEIDPAGAKSLNAMIQGRRKALASRERG